MLNNFIDLTLNNWNDVNFISWNRHVNLVEIEFLFHFKFVSFIHSWRSFRFRFQIAWKQFLDRVHWWLQFKILNWRQSCLQKSLFRHKRLMLRLVFHDWGSFKEISSFLNLFARSMSCFFWAFDEISIVIYFSVVNLWLLFLQNFSRRVFFLFIWRSHVLH